MKIKKVKASVTYPAGFSASGIRAGIRKDGRKDMALLAGEKGSLAAGVFTTNRFPAAPLRVCKEHLKKSGAFRAVLVTSGVANAGTGKRGLRDSFEETALTADALGCRKEDVLVLATGKIGVYLPMEKIRAFIPKAAAELSIRGGRDFSEAIMTTDTFPKFTAFTVSLRGKSFRISGTVKGAGMIEPRMATMLAFITTDAAISRPLMTKALKRAVDLSFNRISVDGCMSTNDTVLLLTSGKADFPRIAKEGKEYRAFCDVLHKVCFELSRMIVLDGEGMSKVMDIRVRKAASVDEARRVAEKVANSNLLKCAVYGGSANWGRVLSAAGAAEARMNENKFVISLCGKILFRNGSPVDVSKETMQKFMQKKVIPITIELGAGKSGYDLASVDLTPDYIKINEG